MDLEAVKQTIERTPHCVVATSSLDGEPWLSPLFFNYDASLNLVWESLRDARHSLLLEENPLIAVYIENKGHIEGSLYAAGHAWQIDPARVGDYLDVYLNGPHQRDDPKRTLSDYAKDSPLGLYEVHLDELYVLKRSSRDGYTVEEREAVDLDALRALFRLA